MDGNAEELVDAPLALLTADQVARALGVSRSWVYEQSRQGRIPTINLGRYRRYRTEAVEAWILERETGTPGAVS